MFTNQIGIPSKNNIKTFQLTYSDNLQEIKKAITDYFYSNLLKKKKNAEKKEKKKPER